MDFGMGLSIGQLTLEYKYEFGATHITLNYTMVKVFFY